MRDLKDIQARNAAFVILSAERADLDASDNVARDARLGREIADITDYHKRVVGCFNGVNERSIMVSVDHGRMDLINAADLARAYGQESILMLGSMQGDGTRPAQIVQCSDPSVVENIGNFKPVSREYAHLHSAYTLDPDTGQYFVAE